VAQVEAAPQLDVLYRRAEQRAARQQRNEELGDTFSDETAAASGLQRRVRRPPCKQEEQRHVPLADEAGDDEQREGKIAVTDVIERRRVEDHRHVEDEEEIGGEDAEPVHVRASRRRSWFHCLTPWPAH
jgi:hypothetical protein